MVKTINIDDIYIRDWSVNLLRQFVEINYTMLSSGSPWDYEVARFWVTMPAEPVEGIDFQLPLSYAQTLSSLTNDAKTSIKNYWGI